MLRNLSHLLSSCRKGCFSLLILLAVHICAQAQVTVSGKVTGAKGEAVIGASVQEKGTQNGTIADSTGSFSLRVKGPKSVLVISYLGLRTTEVTVGGRMSINVKLEEDGTANLNDVVVIGYGTRKKKDVTGALSQISSKDIEKSTAISPEMALQGTASGVLVQSGGGDPNSRPVVRIRGVNTFGDADPLYVVDGVPIFEGGGNTTTGRVGDIRGAVNIYSLINPDDIESISVLKDASAAAIYGVRASNGVVLITTKKGKSGKPKVDFSMYYGIQNIPKRIKTLNTQQYFQLVNEAYNANPDKDGAGNPLPIGASPNYGAPYGPDSPAYAGNNPTTDWVGALTYKNAPLQNYNVSVSGGNDNTTYYVSSAWSSTQSPLKGNNLQRYTVSSSLDSKISKYLRTGFTLRLTQEDALTSTQSDLTDMYVSIPFQPIYDKNDPTGYAPVVTGVFSANPSYDPTLLSPGADSNFSFTYNYGRNTRYNPLALQLLNSTSYRLYNALGNAYVQFEPLPGLRLKGSLGGQYNTNTRNTWINFSDWRFSQTPSNPYGDQDGNAKGSYEVRTSTTINVNKELTLDYSHTFGDHSIDVLLGASEQYSHWSYIDAQGNVNYTDPQFRQIIPQPPYTSATQLPLQDDALIGYLGRVSYKYKDKYYLDGTVRDDGSSELAPGHKFDRFPSFGAAWRISSEDFFPKTKWINDLKIRGGWGRLGNFQSLQTNAYAFLSSVALAPHYSFGSGNGNPYGLYQYGASLPNFANVNLTWEKLRSTSAGFDAVLFAGKVNFTAEYYNKTTFGVIQAVSLPPNTGILTPAELNIGTVRNSGVELQLGYNTKIGEVDFNVSGNFTTISNKVLKLDGDNPFGGNTNRIEEGFPINYLWGYKVGGIFQNQQQIDTWRKSHADVTLGQNLSDPTVGYKYQPGDMYFQDVYGPPAPGSKQLHSNSPDSLITPDDRTYLGKTIPSYTYGFSVGASYKGFDINVLFQGVGGVQGYDNLRALLDNPGSNGNMSTDVLGRWTPTHASNTIPRAIIGDPAQFTRFSNQFVEPAGYVRLKNLTLGYNIPRNLMNKTGFIQTLRVYVTSVNLLTLTKWKGLDPETDLANNPSLSNAANPTPTTRQFLFGVRASF